MIIISGKSFSLYLFNDCDVRLLKKQKVDLQKHHKKGGQSQNRIQRLADESHFNYITQVDETMVRYFIEENSIKNLVIFGPALKKEALKERLDKRLKRLVVGVVNISERESLMELHQTSLQLLDKERVDEENKIIGSIYAMIERDMSDVLVFGFRDISKMNEEYLLKKLIIHQTVIDAGYPIKEIKDNCEVVIIKYHSEIIERFIHDFDGIVGVMYY